MEKLRQNLGYCLPKTKGEGRLQLPLFKFHHMPPRQEVKARRVVCVGAGVGVIDRGEWPGVDLSM